MKALVGTFNHEKALVGAFSVIEQPVVEPMEHYAALFNIAITPSPHFNCSNVLRLASPYLYAGPLTSVAIYILQIMKCKSYYCSNV